MNYNTLTPTEKNIKKAQNFATGHFTTSGEVYNIAIINSGTTADCLLSNVVAGIKQGGAIPLVFNLPGFGFLNKINPAVAKYAQSTSMVIAANTEAIIKTNIIDGVVVISDCDITTAGVLSGCLKCNCPVLVVPNGVNPSFDVDFLKLNGRAVVNATEIDGQLEKASLLEGIQENSTTHTFFKAIEGFGLALKTASANIYLSGKQIALAQKTGKKIVEYAKDLNGPRRLLTKDALMVVAKKIFSDGGAEGFCGFMPIISLLIQNGNKIPHDFFIDIAKKLPNFPLILLRGSACEDGGYAIAKDNLNFSGKAWVYHTLEDADKAISSGAINEGVIVLQNCVGQNVSCILYAIEGMEKQSQIAVVTDGLVEPSSVLAIVNCRPASNENGDFANIQTGDIIELDLAKGRFNTSISAKDMKARAKRNSVKEQPKYFL